MTDKTPLPEVPAPQWDSIPDSMARRQQWLLWKFEWKNDPPKPGEKPAKMPYYVIGGRRTGKQGDDRDAMKLATLEVARRAYDKGGWHGVGFGFLPNDGMIGIDLDAQRDAETGEWSERCRKIIAACDSFTEISPSGKGVHIFVAGQTRTNKSNDIGVEVFCGSQFFTVSGQRFPETPPEVRPIDEVALRRLHKTIDDAKAVHQLARTKPAASPAPQPPLANGETPAQLRARVESALQALSPDGGGYNDWIAIGWALRDAFGDFGFGLWDAWSSAGAKYAGQADLQAHWKSFATRKTPEEAVGVIFARARDAGWKAPPRAGAARPPKKNRDRPAPAAEMEEHDDIVDGEDDDDDDDDAADEISTVQSGAPSRRQVRKVRALFFKGSRGALLDCRENVMYALMHDPMVKGAARKNDFTQLIERAREVPWGRPAGEWDEEDDMMLGEYVLRTYGLAIKSTSTLRQGVLMASRLNRYNPVTDLIRAERWDGIDRLEHWLTDVYEVEERPYTRLIGKCFFMGLVNRAIRPGCKFDYMLIIKSEQGETKSTTFRALAAPWFTDNAIRIGDKDSLMAQQLAWLIESAELESLNKSETTHIKQHLSSQEDWYRLPYASSLQKAPRHSVFVGTTNADTFLKDSTGDRRFWPLAVKVVHVDRLMAMRGQLFAEALHRLEQGERYWPTRQEEKEFVFPEHEPFKRSDPWEDLLNAYVSATAADKYDGPNDLPRARRQFFSTVELFFHALDIKADKIDGAGNMETRIGNSMRALGFDRGRESTGRRRRGFFRRPSESAGAAPPGSPQADSPPAHPDDIEDDDPLPF